MGSTRPVNPWKFNVWLRRNLAIGGRIGNRLDLPPQPTFALVSTIDWVRREAVIRDDANLFVVSPPTAYRRALLAEF